MTPMSHTYTFLPSGQITSQRMRALSLLILFYTHYIHFPWHSLSLCMNRIFLDSLQCRRVAESRFFIRIPKGRQTRLRFLHPATSGNDAFLFTFWTHSQTPISVFTTKLFVNKKILATAIRIIHSYLPTENTSEFRILRFLKILGVYIFLFLGVF